MQFITHGDQLGIKFDPVEQFFGLKRWLDLQREQISTIEWYEELHFTKKIWRLAGAGIPGVLYAGHFRGGGKRYFLYLYRPHGIAWVSGHLEAIETVVITTKNYPYHQILLSCDQATANRLISWYHARTPAKTS